MNILLLLILLYSVRIINIGVIGIIINCYIAYVLPILD